jgi:hypothetical protein
MAAIAVTATAELPSRSVAVPPKSRQREQVEVLMTAAVG